MDSWYVTSLGPNALPAQIAMLEHIDSLPGYQREQLPIHVRHNQIQVRHNLGAWRTWSLRQFRLSMMTNALEPVEMPDADLPSATIDDNKPSQLP